MFLYAWRTSQGWSFFPFILLELGILSGAVMVRPFIVGICILEVAAVMMVFPIQGGRLSSTTHTVRYLALMMLALPCFLIASWLIGLHDLSPDDLSLIGYSVASLSMGFAILLSVVPFHTWLTGVARNAPPMATAFLAIVFSAVGLSLFLQLLVQRYWLTAETSLFELLWWAGLVTALAAGGLAISQRSLGGLLGYAAVSDFGVILMGLSLASTSGAVAAMMHVFHRAIGVMLLAMAAGAIRHSAGTWDLDELAGVGKRMPLAAFGLLVGGLSLAGFPLTCGFSSRWLLYGGLAQERLVWPALVASACVLVASLRATAALFREGDLTTTAHEPRSTAALIFAGSTVCLALGLYPSFLFTMVSQVVSGLPFL
jgi:multicomponent Na+:H+ antiporter subunit D